MKYLTIDLPGEAPCVVMFSPQIGHDTMRKLLGNPHVYGAGFVTVPAEALPRPAGHSTSLKLGPSAMDATLLDVGFRHTASQYPYQPLFDALTPVEPAKR